MTTIQGSYLQFSGDRLLSTEARRDLLWFLVYLTLYFVVFGLMGLRLGMHHDEIIDFDGTQTGIYITQGRWATALWRSMMGYGACGWIANLAAGFFVSAALVMVTHLLKATSGYNRLVAGCFYFSVIQFKNMLAASVNSDTVALSYLVCTSAVFLLIRGGLFRFLVSIVLVTFAFGLYQASCFYFIAVWIAWQLRTWQLKEGRGAQLAFSSAALNIARMVLCGLVAFCAWSAVECVALRHPCITEYQRNFAEIYQSGINGWNIIQSLSLPDQIEHVKSVFLFCFWSLLGRCYTGQWVYATALIPIAGLTIYWFRKYGFARGLIPVAYTVILWVMPYALCIVLLRQQALHTYLTEPLSLSCLWLLFVCLGFSHRFSYTLLTVFMPFMVLKSAYTVAAEAREERRVFSNFQEELRQLASVATETARQHQDVTLPAIVLHTGRRYIFLDFYARYCGVEKYIRSADSNERELNHQLMESLPAYPAHGSVHIKDGKIYIRMFSPEE